MSAREPTLAQTEHLTPFRPALPAAPGERLQWGRLYGAATSLAAAAAATTHTGLTLVVVDDVQNAARVATELKFFSSGGLDVLSFPDWETLPYDVFSPLPELISQRLLALHRLPELQRGLLVVPVATLLQRLPPRAYLEAHTLQIESGQRLDPDRFRQRLERAGYRCV